MTCIHDWLLWHHYIEILKDTLVWESLISMSTTSWWTATENLYFLEHWWCSTDSDWAAVGTRDKIYSLTLRGSEHAWILEKQRTDEFSISKFHLITCSSLSYGRDISLSLWYSLRFNLNVFRIWLEFPPWRCNLFLNHLLRMWWGPMVCCFIYISTYYHWVVYCFIV